LNISIFLFCFSAIVLLAAHDRCTTNWRRTGEKCLNEILIDSKLFHSNNKLTLCCYKAYTVVSLVIEYVVVFIAHSSQFYW